MLRLVFGEGLRMNYIRYFNEFSQTLNHEHHLWRIARAAKDRLKEDIEKSRATYLKRYGNTAAATGDYFNQELIRSLAEDDVSLLGKNFQR